MADTALMAAPRCSGIELHSVPAELLHSILASRESLRCRDLGRLASTCRLFNTAHVFTATHARSSRVTTAHDIVSAAAEAIVNHRSPAVLARLMAGRLLRKRGECWLRALAQLEILEGHMRGWTGCCVVGQDVWEHRMCTFDAWVKEAKTIPHCSAVTKIFNDVAGVREIRSDMELMVGYTVLETEYVLNNFEEDLILPASSDYASAFEFIVRFLQASLTQKEHTLLLPWVEKLDSFGHQVHRLPQAITHSGHCARPAGWEAPLPPADSRRGPGAPVAWQPAGG
jgi:hypothetical protein